MARQFSAANRTLNAGAIFRAPAFGHVPRLAERERKSRDCGRRRGRAAAGALTLRDVASESKAMAGRQLSFATDDQLAKRLERVESALEHLAAAMPSLRQQVRAIRLELEPSTSDAREVP
jgi:hypothetical protein